MSLEEMFVEYLLKKGYQKKFLNSLSFVGLKNLYIENTEYENYIKK